MQGSSLDKNRLHTLDKYDNIFFVSTNVFFGRTQEGGKEATMEKENKYFVLKQRAVPEVLLRVVDAKKLLESERAMTVISRSSFYKYKDDIFPFHDNAKGKTITLTIQMDDEQGLLSDLLHVVAVYKANILTIHQSIPVNGVAMLTLSVEIRNQTGDVSAMIEEMETMDGIRYVKILARE